tara:strand:+ start:3509 stop:4093 length:585 start_codon:yes stop_codon:yes gene_type:complete
MYATGLETCRNWIVLPHGGLTVRPGTRFVAEVKDSTKNARLLPFEFSTEEAYVIENLSLDQARQRLKALLAAERYHLETGGVTFSPSSGPEVSVPTDRDSQVRVWGFYLRASQMDEAASVIWKHPDGYISLSRADALRMASEVGNHIQEAFDREAAVAARIDAAVSLDLLKEISIDLSGSTDADAGSSQSGTGT